MNTLIPSQTLLQIRKDFGSKGDFIPEAWTHYEDLLDAVFKALEQAQKENKLLSLIYRIDIPEADYNMAKKDPNFLTVLSELVIKRAFIKVMLRNQFSLESTYSAWETLKEK